MIRKLFFVIVVLSMLVTSVFAGHNGAVITPNVGECGETTFFATIADPAGTHKVSNMYMVVSVNGVTQNVNVPIDGSSAQITVGPFFDNTTIYWNVFGGGERAYDQPLWNGYGTASFSSDISAYASVNGWGWILAGPENSNPFVNWNSVPVVGCPLTKDQCKNDGWQALGFPTQGRCIQATNKNDK